MYKGFSETKGRERFEIFKRSLSLLLTLQYEEADWEQATAA